MSGSALDELFRTTRAEQRAAFVGYLPAGYPSVAESATWLDALVGGGADAVEIGLPFSDPVLDGPTVATAQRASLAGGFRVRDVFHLVERVAAHGAVPVVMSYINPILAYGFDRFTRDLASAGGAGVITPDLIVDEAEEWLAATAAAHVAPIFLVAPSSTDERMARTTAACRGFVYAASLMGTTGVREAVSSDAPDLVNRCRAHTELPIGVGLGVRTGAQARQIAQYADAVIVGSALVAAGDDGGPTAIRGLAEELAAGVRGAHSHDVSEPDGVPATPDGAT